MKNIVIRGSEVVDWTSFHDVFSKALAFPDFYGKNMNAWIDCLTDLSLPCSGMTNLELSDDESLLIQFTDSCAFKKRCPEIFDALIECSQFVNQRSQRPLLAIAFC